MTSRCDVRCHLTAAPPGAAPRRTAGFVYSRPRWADGARARKLRVSSPVAQHQAVFARRQFDTASAGTGRVDGHQGAAVGYAGIQNQSARSSMPVKRGHALPPLIHERCASQGSWMTCRPVDEAGSAATPRWGRQSPEGRAAPEEAHRVRRAAQSEGPDGRRLAARAQSSGVRRAHRLGRSINLPQDDAVLARPTRGRWTFCW